MRKTTTLVFTLLLCCAWLSPLEALAQQAHSVVAAEVKATTPTLSAEQAQPGLTQNVLVTTWISLKNSDGTTEPWVRKVMGSGFFVGPGLIMTSSHVVVNDTQRFALCSLSNIPAGQCHAKVTVQMFGPGNQPGVPIPAWVVGRDSKKDALLLSIPEEGPGAAQLAKQSSVHEGDQVYFAGNRPDLLNATFVGTVATRYGGARFNGQSYNFPVQTLCAPVAHGNSGSAVREVSTSEVVGMIITGDEESKGYLLVSDELNDSLVRWEQQGIIKQYKDDSGATLWTLTLAGAETVNN